MIVWIASYPRSGNTFFRILLHHLYGINTLSIYDEKHDQHERPLFPHVFTDKGDTSFQAFRDVVGLEERPASLEELEADEDIHFVKTHGQPTGKAPAVYLIRDGRDTLVSYAHFLLTFVKNGNRTEDIQAVMKHLIQGEDTYGSWDEHVCNWARRIKEAPTAWLRYEDLIRQPVATVDAVLRSLNVALPSAKGKFPTFEELQRKWPAFFRKGKVGAWRDEMPAALEALFWKRFGHTMEVYGYSREGCEAAQATPGGSGKWAASTALRSLSRILRLVSTP